LKTPNIDFMRSFVEDYINGRIPRWQFDLDFSHHLISRYRKMERESPIIADCFACYLDEMGFEAGQSLPDDEYLDLIEYRYSEFVSALEDGMF